MKDILKNRKNLIIIGGIVAAIIVIFILIFFVFNGKKEKEMSPETLENKLEKVGTDFYEKYYYSNLKSENKLDQLANFKDSGIKIDITNLELLITIDQAVKDQLEKDKCDLDQTKIIIYPEEPYGEKDYTMELELSCEK